NYLVDIRFDSAALKERLRNMARSKSELLDARGWTHLAKIAAMTAAKKAGLRRWLVSRRIDRLLREKSDSYLDWTMMNHAWLERERKPVVIYFEDLIRDPISTVSGAIESLKIGLAPKTDSVPTFAELKKHYPSFFRKGTSGDWRNHFSPAQEESFRSKHRAMMKTLDFPC
ncbi:MAG: sulfotransferase domain-containing protein, partial [Acidobacteriota bacterium]